MATLQEAKQAVIDRLMSELQLDFTTDVKPLAEALKVLTDAEATEVHIANYRAEMDKPRGGLLDDSVVNRNTFGVPCPDRGL